MAFRIESDDGIGPLIARLQVPNVEALQAQSLQNQQAREQIARAPLVRQQLEQEIQAQKYANQEHALSLQENAAYQQIMQKHAGEKDPYGAARGELAGVLRPKTLADLDAFHDTHAGKITENKYKQTEIAKMQNELDNAYAEQRGAMAEQVLRSSNPYTTMSATLSAMEDAHPDRKAAIDAVRQQLEQTDDYADVMRLAAGFRTAKSQADAQALLEKKQQQKASEATTAETKARTGLVEAQTPGAKAKSDLEVAQANALKTMDDGAWQRYIDTVIDDKNSPLYKRTQAQVNFYRQQGNLKAADDAVKAAGEQLGKTESAVATAKATAGTKIEIAAAGAENRAEQRVTPMLVPDNKGGYTLQNFKQGDVIPAGAVTASGLSTTNVPTANTRAMVEKAPRVIQFVDRINQLLDENEKELGPLKGRWTEFTAGKIGLKDKGYSKLRTDMGLLQTALMNMHVGARGGGQMMEHFSNLINLAGQDPDNLRAALGEIRDYAQTVQSEAQPKQSGTTGTTGAPKVEKWDFDANGKLVKK